ncbi:MAG: triose-phosphate isomerase [Xanthomonadaceae bacterium]|nr:triose-phosphate isomerase [Xanthomonadaceae bacterium]MDE2178984.1 triose-phosphate isomerase [Xanthomonadaceae bacterium]MDE2245595.1 triose-phosphate isomerase [Xanthomonadaceae bacterium]
MRRKLVAANWKMHGSRVANRALLDALAAALPGSCDVIVFAPFPYLAELITAHASAGIGFGGQDVSAHAVGAYTGEVAAAMLGDIGCTHVLVGHSERRQYHGEDDAQVAAKFMAAQAGGLIPVLCIGETLQQREAGATESVLARQLDAVMAVAGAPAFARALIAYEPVWAIGSGRAATTAQAQEAHAFIRSQLASADAKLSGLTRILYGGSVKAAHAADLFAQPDVDGGLVGGASLLASEFLAICAAAR